MTSDPGKLSSPGTWISGCDSLVLRQPCAQLDSDVILVSALGGDATDASKISLELHPVGVDRSGEE